MNFVKKFENIYQSYHDCPDAFLRGSLQHTDLFSLPSVLAPLHEYDFLKKEIRFNKAKRIAGYKASEFSTIDDLYNLKESTSVDSHLEAARKSFELLKENERVDNGVLSMKMQSYISFKGRGGRRAVYKRISVDTGRVNGKISHTATFLEEITQANPQRLTAASIIINNGEKYDLEIDELNRFKKILSPREVEILGLITRGFTSADIANGLGISVHTVKTQRKNMIRKLDVSNSAELVNLARDMGL